MVANGLRDAGYVYVNLDDGWVSGRFPNGSIIPDPRVFPHGVKAVADYLHSIGMRSGLYTSRGETTCLRRTGSQDHEALDMQQYADWVRCPIVFATHCLSVCLSVRRAADVHVPCCCVTCDSSGRAGTSAVA